MPTSPGSPFAAAADRLDRFVAEVKERQYAATGVKAMPLAPPLHRGEVWLRTGATHTIRPLRPGDAAPPMPEFTVLPDAVGPRRPEGVPAEPASQAARPNVNPNMNAGHIGAVLGKPAKKPGLLRRLFRGRGN